VKEIPGYSFQGSSPQGVQTQDGKDASEHLWRVSDLLREYFREETDMLSQIDIEVLIASLREEVERVDHAILALECVAVIARAPAGATARRSARGMAGRARARTTPANHRLRVS
jgi:hypothetical protein